MSNSSRYPGSAWTISLAGTSPCGNSPLEERGRGTVFGLQCFLYADISKSWETDGAYLPPHTFFGGLIVVVCMLGRRRRKAGIDRIPHSRKGQTWPHRRGICLARCKYVRTTSSPWIFVSFWHTFNHSAGGGKSVSGSHTPPVTQSLCETDCRSPDAILPCYDHLPWSAKKNAKLSLMLSLAGLVCLCSRIEITFLI